MWLPSTALFAVSMTTNWSYYAVRMTTNYHFEETFWKWQFFSFFIVFDTVHTWEPSVVSGSKTNTWRLRAIIWQQTTKENLQLQTVVFFVFLCLISVKLSLDWRFSAKIFHFWGYLSKSEDLNIFETFMSLSYIQYSNKGTCFFSSTMSKIFFI